MFASKTPRDLNRDPWPYVSNYDGSRWYAEGGVCWPEAGPDAGLVHEWSTALTRDPRPEFDHTQHNEPNPILLAFRGYAEKHGMDSDQTIGLARLWVARARYYEHHLNVGGRRASNAHRDHARRVLTRLANLEGASA